MGEGMTFLGCVTVLILWLAFLIGAFNTALDWWHDYERSKMGLGCWLYQIGVIWKP